MSDKETKIAKIVAEQAAKAAKARANQDAAAAVAKAKKPRTDAQIMRGAGKQGVDTSSVESPGEAEKVGRPAEKGKSKLAKAAKVARPSVDVNAETKVLGPKQSAGSTAFKLDIPQGDTKVFDFENKPTVTKAPPVEVPTQVHLAEKAKARVPELPGAKASAHPSSEIHLPDRPLEGQGSMADKPVTKVTVKVSDKLLTKKGAAAWNAAKDADRRITQGAAPQAERRAALSAQKVMTPTGAVEATAPVAPKPSSSSVGESMRASMQAGRGATKFMPEVESSVKAAYKSLAQMGQRKSKSLATKVAEKAGSALGKGLKWSGTAAGKTAVGIVKHVLVEPFKPIAEFAAGHGARKAAYTAAGPVGKAFQLGASALGGTVAAARTTGRIGLTLAEGIAIEGAWTGGREAARQIEAGQADIRKKAAHAQKYNLKVTAPGYNESLLRSFTGGSPKIKVEEIDTSLRAKRLARGSAKNTELAYNALKKVSSRDVIRGSSKV